MYNYPTSAFPLKVRHVPFYWGKQVAYFDPNDPGGYLYIANSQGIVHKILPGSAYWLSQPYRILPFLRDKPIEWSADGSKVLILGRGSENQPCPSSEIVEGPAEGSHQNDACWQVIDSAKGEVVWQLSDVLPELISKAFISSYNAKDFDQTTISADGHWLAVSGIIGSDPLLFIVEVESKDVVWWDFMYAEEMRWVRQSDIACLAADRPQ